MSHVGVHFSLFLVCFAAATIFPAQSEVLLAKLVLDEHYKWWVLIIVASIGNTLGSAANWVLGRYFSHFKDRKWFPIKPERMQHFENQYQRYGKWSLLLSWMPFIGDPLTIMAGVLREPFHIFVLIVAIAKTSRYLVVVGLAQTWI